MKNIIIRLRVEFKTILREQNEDNLAFSKDF